MYRWRSVVVCAMLGAFGCGVGDTITEPTGAESADQTYKRAAAARLASVLAYASVRELVIGALRQRSPQALSELAGLIGEIDVAAERGVVPELSLREPAGSHDSAGLQVAWAPPGDEATWTEIPAYLLGGASKIDPSAEVEGEIGPNVAIGAGARVRASRIEDAVILPWSVVDCEGEIRHSLLGGSVSGAEFVGAIHHGSA